MFRRTPRVTRPDTLFPYTALFGSGVGLVPEGRRVFSNLTVDENLKLPVDRPGPWNIARVYELFPRLAERKGHKGRQFSGGEQEMLSIARVLLLNPNLLLLDEPSNSEEHPSELQSLMRISYAVLRLKKNNS